MAPRRPTRTLSTVDSLVQLSFLVHGTLERRAAAHGVSITQMRLLGILRDRTPTMNELAGYLGLDKSSVSGLVERAERGGLVARRTSPSDRRVVQVRLSTKGRASVKRIAALIETDLAQIVQTLPAADRKHLTHLLSRVLTAHAHDHGVDLFASA